MAKYFSIPNCPESEDCPAVPRPVRVWGDASVEKTKNDNGAAIAVLARALASDPELSEPHPEFLSPEDREGKKATEKKSAK